MSQVPYAHVSGPHGCPRQFGKDVYLTHENLTNSNSRWGGNSGNAPCENPRSPPSGEQSPGASEKPELGTLSTGDWRPSAVSLAVEKERASSVLLESTNQPRFVPRPGGCERWGCFPCYSASGPQGHLGSRGLSRGEAACEQGLPPLHLRSSWHLEPLKLHPCPTRLATPDPGCRRRNVHRERTEDTSWSWVDRRGRALNSEIKFPPKN